MRAIFITITIVALMAAAPAQDSVTVPCKKEKCEELRLFNQIVDIRNAEDEDLVRVNESLIHDPPGYGVSIDRQARLDALIKSGEAVEALYRDAGAKAHERTEALRRMRQIERK